MKIADGIEFALREAENDRAEKVASEQKTAAAASVSAQMKLAAQKIRENRVDVKIQDLQEFMGVFG